MRISENVEFLTIGNKVKKIRRLLDIKQGDLEVIGITRSYLSMIENDKRKLTEKLAARLVEVFSEKAKDAGIPISITTEELLEDQSEQANKYCARLMESSEAVIYYDKVMKIAEKFQLSNIKVKANIIKANFLYENEQYINAFEHYFDALDLISHYDDKGLHASLYKKMGQCKVELGDKKESILYFNKSIQYAEVSGNEDIIKESSLEASMILNDIGEFEKALVYVDKFLFNCNIVAEFGDYVDACIVKSQIHCNLKNYDIAKQILTDTLAKFSDPKNGKVGEINLYFGIIFMTLDKYEKALKYLETAEEVLLYNSSMLLPKLALQKYKVFKVLEIGNPISELEQSYKMASEKNDIKTFVEAVELLDAEYEAVGAHEKMITLYNTLIEFMALNTKCDALKSVFMKLATKYVSQQHKAIQDAKNQ